MKGERRYIKRPRLCSVEGCWEPHQARGWCTTHYERVRKYGEPGEAARRQARDGEGNLTALGYRMLRMLGHPLAGADGRVYEHRVELFSTIGPGSHPCHWCGVMVEWRASRSKGPTTGSLCVDHLDEDRLNNRRDNLVPSCRTCNIARSKKPEGSPFPRKKKASAVVRASVPAEVLAHSTR